MLGVCLGMQLTCIEFVAVLSLLMALIQLSFRSKHVTSNYRYDQIDIEDMGGT